MRRSGLLFAALFAVGILIMGNFYYSTVQEGELARENANASETAGEGSGEGSGETVAAPLPVTGTVTESGGQAISADRPRISVTVSGEANGTIVIELFDDVAPLHVERITSLVASGAYDGVVFHRVIEGFMAQTGDVEFGRADGNMDRAGMGGSDLPDLTAEFSDLTFARGFVGMARSSNPNSANSQFFIMLKDTPNLDGQYTIVGQVTSGMDVLDAIKLGTGGNGSVIGAPDVMQSVTVNQ